MQRPLSVMFMLLFSNGLPANSSAPSVFQAFVELPNKLLNFQQDLSREKIVGDSNRTEKREIAWGEGTIEVRKNVNTQFLKVDLVQPEARIQYTLRAFHSNAGHRMFLVQKQHCTSPGCEATISVVEKQGSVWKNMSQSLLPDLSRPVLTRAYMETTGKAVSDSGEELDYHLQIPEEGNLIEVWNQYDEKMFSLNWNGQKFVIKTR